MDVDRDVTNGGGIGGRVPSQKFVVTPYVPPPLNEIWGFKNCYGTSANRNQLAAL